MGSGPTKLFRNGLRTTLLVKNCGQDYMSYMSMGPGLSCLGRNGPRSSRTGPKLPYVPSYLRLDHEYLPPPYNGPMTSLAYKNVEMGPGQPLVSVVGDGIQTKYTSIQTL